MNRGSARAIVGCFQMIDGPGRGWIATTVNCDSVRDSVLVLLIKRMVAIQVWVDLS